jgi:sugar/nucleoside kinase (ribokinase family)
MPSWRTCQGSGSSVKRYDVITFGDMCVDLIVSGGDIVPRFGQVEQLVGDYALEMGGSCCLFACQAAKLGLRTAILGRVGNDAFGRLILDRLEGCGVNTAYVAVDPSLKTGLGIALCREDDRAILTYMGSISAIRVDDVTDGFFASAHHLHYGSYFLHAGLLPHAPAILRRARALGLTVSLDTNWDPAERWNSTLQEALSLTDLAFPNEQEALRISGASTLQDAMDAFLAWGVSVVALKQGARGASAYDGQSSYGCSVKPAMGGDSIGAGDSFDAGFVAGWLSGLRLPECLELACTCGAAVAGATGGLRGQPCRDQVMGSTGTVGEEP